VSGLRGHGARRRLVVARQIAPLTPAAFRGAALHPTAAIA
jgi:hypothetical protein